MTFTGFHHKMGCRDRWNNFRAWHHVEASILPQCNQELQTTLSWSGGVWSHSGGGTQAAWDYLERKRLEKMRQAVTAKREAPGPSVSMLRNIASQARMAVSFEGSAKHCSHTTLEEAGRGCLTLLARLQVGWLCFLKNLVYCVINEPWVQGLPWQDMTQQALMNSWGKMWRNLCMYVTGFVKNCEALATFGRNSFGTLPSLHVRPQA